MHTHTHTHTHFFIYIYCKYVIYPDTLPISLYDVPTMLAQDSIFNITYYLFSFNIIIFLQVKEQNIFKRLSYRVCMCSLNMKSKIDLVLPVDIYPNDTEYGTCVLLLSACRWKHFYINIELTRAYYWICV